MISLHIERTGQDQSGTSRFGCSEGPKKASVKVTNLPEQLRSSGALEEYFRSAMGDAIISAKVTTDNAQDENTALFFACAQARNLLE